MRPTILLSFAVILSLGAAACGGDDKNEATEKACEDYCAKAFECGLNIGYDDPTTCPDLCKDELQAYAEGCREALVTFMSCYAALTCEQVSGSCGEEAIAAGDACG